MKKKYVVYSVVSYFDDYGCLHFHKQKECVCSDEEDANSRAYEIRNMGYGVKIEEMWGK